MPRANTSSRLGAMDATAGPELNRPSPSWLQPVQLVPSPEILYIRLSVPRANTSIRPGPQETAAGSRSEEHTSELQSHSDLVCRLLLEKKNKQKKAKTKSNHANA